MFSGWVKQPSACCGAASVAGAWNALFGLHRSNVKSKKHVDVLAMFEQMFEELIEKKRKSFDRKLGAEIASFLTAIGEHLRRHGREIGGKKGSNATKKAVLAAVMSLCTDYYHSSNYNHASIEEELKCSRSAEECFIELLTMEGHSFLSDVRCNSDRNSEHKSGEDKAEDIDDSDEVLETQQHCCFQVYLLSL